MAPGKVMFEITTKGDKKKKTPKQWTEAYLTSTLEKRNVKTTKT